jgi:hypothetical protein
MSGPTEPTPARRHLPLYAVVAAAAIVALALAASTGGFTLERITDTADSITRVVLRLHSATVYFLIIGALCYSATRDGRYLLFAIIGAALVIVVAFIPSWFPSASGEFRSVPSVLHDVGMSLVSPIVIVPFAFLFATRFFARFERLRIATLALSLAFVALQIGVRLSFLENWRLLQVILTLMEEIVLAALTLALLASAWCLAFRQAPPHRPPTDAAKTLALTCPRCQNPLTITLPYGQCPACRLQLNVALEEGVCAKCHYPLRGLSGDICPECGTPFVQSPTPSSTP